MSPSILANSLGVSKVFFFWSFSSKESNSGGFPTGLPSYKISGHCKRKHLFHTLMAHTKRNTRVFTQCTVFISIYIHVLQIYIQFPISLFNLISSTCSSCVFGDHAVGATGAHIHNCIHIIICILSLFNTGTYI